MAIGYEHTQYLKSALHILGTSPDAMTREVDATSGESFFLSRFDPGFNGTIVNAEVNFAFSLTDTAPIKISGTGADDNAVGTIAWTSPTFIQIEDDSDGIYTSASMTATTTSHYIKGTNYGFNVPTSAVITGIKVTVRRREDGAGAGSLSDNVVSMVKGGAVTGDNNAAAGTWTTWSTASYGGEGDLWGTTWTAAQINASDFGVVLSVDCDSGGVAEAQLAWMKIEVFYTYSLQYEWEVNPQGLGWETIKSDTSTVAVGDTSSPLHEDILVAADFTNAKTPFDVRLQLTAAGDINPTVTVTETENYARVTGVSE
jgi:hypothetical protein